MGPQADQAGPLQGVQHDDSLQLLGSHRRAVLCANFLHQQVPYLGRAVADTPHPGGRLPLDFPYRGHRVPGPVPVPVQQDPGQQVGRVRSRAVRAPQPVFVALPQPQLDPLPHAASALRQPQLDLPRRLPGQDHQPLLRVRPHAPGLALQGVRHPDRHRQRLGQPHLHPHPAPRLPLGGGCRKGQPGPEVPGNGQSVAASREGGNQRIQQPVEDSRRQLPQPVAVQPQLFQPVQSLEDPLGQLLQPVVLQPQPLQVNQPAENPGRQFFQPVVIQIQPRQPGQVVEDPLGQSGQVIGRQFQPIQVNQPAEVVGLQADQAGLP